MTMEFWTAFGSVGTLVVIAVTAIIAVVQVRHVRAANQAQFLQNLFMVYESDEFRGVFNFVRTDLGPRLQDSAFRRELRWGDWNRAQHPEIIAAEFFEQLSHSYRAGAIDRRVFLPMFGRVIIAFWEYLEPVIALTADPVYGNLSFQSFERVTAEARRWVERHPYGTFPKGAKRVVLRDPWRDIDTRSGAGAASP